MKVKIIGFEHIEYTNKSGQLVKGLTAHYAVPIQNGKGHKTQNVFFRPENFGLPYDLEPGEYNIEYGCTSNGKAYLTNFSK